MDRNKKNLRHNPIPGSPGVLGGSIIVLLLSPSLRFNYCFGLLGVLGVLGVLGGSIIVLLLSPSLRFNYCFGLLGVLGGSILFYYVILGVLAAN